MDMKPKLRIALLVLLPTALAVACWWMMRPVEHTAKVLEKPITQKTLMPMALPPPEDDAPPIIQPLAHTKYLSLAEPRGRAGNV